MNSQEVKDDEIVSGSLLGTTKKRDSRAKSTSLQNYITAIMLFFGFVNGSSLRTNLTIAIVDMTSNRTVVTKYETFFYNPDFDWDSRTRSFVLNVFFYGYLIGAFGSPLVTKFGGVRLYGLCILIGGILTSLIPLTLSIHFYLFFIGRFFEGVSAVLAYTSVTEIWTVWSFTKNGSKLVSLSLIGVYVGSCITYPVGGFLCHKFGWRAIFFMTGGLAIIWSFLWIFLLNFGFLISSDSHLSNDRKNILKNTPWKNILKSTPVHALSCIKFAYAWANTLFVMCFPSYIKDITNYDIHQVGILSAIPAFIDIFMIPVFGYIMDWLLEKFSPSAVHKFYVSFGFLIGAANLTLVAWVPNFVIRMIGLVLFSFSLCMIQLPLQLIPAYLAPDYASVLTGFTTSFYTISLILCPLFIGVIVENHDPFEWSVSFSVSAFIMFIGFLVYFMFGTSNQQPWTFSSKIENNDYIKAADSDVKEPI